MTENDNESPTGLRRSSVERRNIIVRQPSVEIDDSLYSRQRYVLGDEAMKQMHKASILIIGLGGVGVEVAKNLVSKHFSAKFRFV